MAVAEALLVALASGGQEPADSLRAADDVIGALAAQAGACPGLHPNTQLFSALLGAYGQQRGMGAAAQAVVARARAVAGSGAADAAAVDVQA
jgi:hypothetical protein